MKRKPASKPDEPTALEAKLVESTPIEVLLDRYRSDMLDGKILAAQDVVIDLTAALNAGKMAMLKYRTNR